MSDLSGSERRKLEKLFLMESGYVLNFSDRTFSGFFNEYRVEIDNEQYKIGGTSKANRMRTYHFEPALRREWFGLRTFYTRIVAFQACSQSLMLWLEWPTM